MNNTDQLMALADEIGNAALNFIDRETLQTWSAFIRQAASALASPEDGDAGEDYLRLLVQRALKALTPIYGETLDTYTARVREHAAQQVADKSAAGFAWQGHMVHGDRASVQAVVDMVANPPAPAGEDARDAAKYRFLANMKACSFSISYNDHHNMYESVEQTFAGFAGDPKAGYYADVPEEEKRKMIETDTIWTLHIYPNTPIGFNVYHAATLDAAIDAALSATGTGGGHG